MLSAQRREKLCFMCSWLIFVNISMCLYEKGGRSWNESECQRRLLVFSAAAVASRFSSWTLFQLNRERRSCFWISYKKVQRWKMSRFQETNTLMHLCLALGRLAIKFSHSTSFWSWSPQTRAQSSLPSWLPPSSLLPCWRPAMVTAVKTWVRCSVSCPGGGTWPFSIQDYGLDYNEKWKLQLYW